ncbi:MAG TPA: hypothetical protein VLD39_11655, partial [Gammaproteobacteria bacterium]|nr:hypothetical protein [Gammaproteobacteria bacterium]
MSERVSGGIRLGACYIDPGTGRATGPAGAAHLSPAAVAALMCLASRPRSKIAPDTLADASRVEPARLAEVIAELDAVIRDERGALIESLGTDGFRLLALPERTDPRPAASGILQELRRRGVIETALAYLVVGWLLLQISDVTFDQLLLPAWAGTFLAYLVIIGFPIAVALAWFLELTPRGLVLDGDDRSKPPRALAKPYVAIVAALAIASVSVYLFDRHVGLVGDRSPDTAAGAGVTATVVDPNSIAVLPFLNISTTDDGQIFANGLTEDVINRLARV